MKIQDIFDHLSDIRESLSKDFPELTLDVVFPLNRGLINNWRKEQELPVPVKGDGIGNKSGIYFILSESYDVLYIGKATTNNIHERIWGHIKTPQVNADGSRSFPKNNFINRNLPSVHVNDIASGKARLTAVEVYPADYSSLVEVYLHTLHLKQEGCIPPLNKQIG